SNEDSTSIDDDSFSIDNIEYFKVSPPDSELISLEVMEIVISEVGGIDKDILLAIKDDILREKLLNINLLIANIEALKDNPTPYFDFMTKSSSTSFNFLLEETNTFDNSLPEFETFCFDSKKNSSGSTTTNVDISLPDYEAFYDDHVKEISSGSTTTHSEFYLYDSFIFDLSINPFPPADRSDFYEFADELAHIISTPEYDCFSFKNEPNSGDFTIDVVEDTFPTREPRVHVPNVLPTHPTLQLNLDFILSSESLFTYVSNKDSTSIDDDSFSIDNIEYFKVSPPNSELISLEVMEIVIPEVGGIDKDILLSIKDDILREKLLNINLLIANIEALKDNPTQYFDFMTKSSSTSFNFLLEETNTFDNSLPEFETFCFDLEKNSSGSTTTRVDISLPDYEAFYDDHVKEISSGSTTTHSDFYLYDSFIFDLSINPFPPADRSDFYEFVDELAHIISPPEYDCFAFKNEPNSGDFTIDVVDDTFSTREPRVHVPNVLPTHPTLQLNLDFILSSESLFTYVVWIFLYFLSYSVAPQYLLSFENEDTIFDPGISICHSFMPNVSHRSETFIKFNVYPKYLNGSPMEILFSTCSTMD
nr:hypothetical protein [Tanacetum cinerariifolium]